MCRKITKGAAGAFAFGVLALMAAPASAQHGVSIFKSCVSPQCVGDTTDCEIGVGHADFFGDTVRVDEVFDIVDPANDAVRVPAVGNLPIVSVSGNTTCMVGGSLPCNLGPGGSVLNGLPGDPNPGLVFFGSDTYVILADDPDPLPDQGTARVTDLCDDPDTMGCSGTQNTVQFSGSTDIEPCCGNGVLEDGEECDGEAGACPGACSDNCVCEEGCCLADGTCIITEPDACVEQGGEPLGPGSQCGGEVTGCCFEEGLCLNMDSACCELAGGTVQDGLCQAVSSSCCTASGGLGCDNADCQAAVCAIDPFCCDVAWDGICASEALDLCSELCAGATQGCCLEDGTCIDVDPLCCDDAGGTPQGPGSACNGIQACCFEDGTCQEMDPLCCEAAGGTPLGEGSTCGGAQEGCCFPDNTCLNLDSACCTLQGGTPQGEGTECGGLAGCCLPEGAGCVNMDPLCCDEAGGTPQDGLCATGGTSDCCTASGGLGCDNEDCEATVCAVDPFCCDTSWDSICAEEAVDLCGGLCAATVQGCCLPDGTCIEIDPLCCEEAGGTPTGGSCTTEGCCFPDNTCQDLDPECCVLEGGTPQGEGSACNGIEACCLEDGTCEEMDPLCCDEAGGTPQGPGSTCGGEVQGCCLPDGTCENLDPTCCTAQDGTPVTGTCTASEACCLPDDTCVDMDPLCCALQGGTSQGPGSTCATTTCGGGEGCTPGYWKLIDISPGNASHECNWTDPYDPTDLFSDHFENAFPGKTLVQVLGLSGGGLNALGRHTVAALLNAASADVDFGQSPQDVIDAFNAVFPGTNAQYEELKNEFAAGNESCCPIGNCKCTAGTQKLCNLSGSQACGAGQGTCANSSDAAENCD